jgi:putative nucleotidyltransferase with HDIG domain
VTPARTDLLDLCDRMPAFPASVQKVLALASDMNTAPKDLVRVVEHDPVLTMKLLKVANSAYFGLSRSIVSVNHAVVYLGINTVRHVALAIAAIGVLPRENSAHFDTDDFLLHSMCTAVIARALARKLRIPEVEAANFFVAGLLHDIGQVVFSQFEAEGFRAVLERARAQSSPIYLVEQALLGADHSELGAMLSERWQLPSEVSDAIRAHHIPPSRPGRNRVRDCVFVANLLSGRMYEPQNGPPAMPEADLPAWVFRDFGGDFDAILLHLDGVEDEVTLATEMLRM